MSLRRIHALQRHRRRRLGSRPDASSGTRLGQFEIIQKLLEPIFILIALASVTPMFIEWYLRRRRSQPRSRRPGSPRRRALPASERGEQLPQIPSEECAGRSRSQYGSAVAIDAASGRKSCCAARGLSQISLLCPATRRASARSSTSGGSPSHPSDAMITTAPRNALPYEAETSSPMQRPRCVPPYRSVTSALARPTPPPPERCDSAAVRPASATSRTRRPRVEFPSAAGLLHA